MGRFQITEREYGTASQWTVFEYTADSAADAERQHKAGVDADWIWVEATDFDPNADSDVTIVSIEEVDD